MRRLEARRRLRFASFVVTVLISLFCPWCAIAANVVVVFGGLSLADPKNGEAFLRRGKEARVTGAGESIRSSCSSERNKRGWWFLLKFQQTTNEVSPDNWLRPRKLAPRSGPDLGPRFTPSGRTRGSRGFRVAEGWGLPVLGTDAGTRRISTLAA